MSKENRIVTRDAFVRSTTAEQLENRQVEFVISSEALLSSSSQEVKSELRSTSKIGIELR